MKELKKKNMTMTKAVLTVVVLMGLLFWSIIWGTGNAQIPLIAATIFASIMGLTSGYSADDIQKGMYKGISDVIELMVILMVIGMLIASWVAAGVVPAMIYYGLKLISPKIFLFTTLVVCSITAVVSGSSWTALSTVGIALLGVSYGLQIPAPITAGAIISGSYFGDKLSPLSDTTNLASSIAGANLFDHVKHMIYTTGVSWIVSAVIFLIIGFKYGSGHVDSSYVQEIFNGLTSQFTITPLLLIPPLLTIIIIVKRIPAIPGLLMGVILGLLFAITIQKQDLVFLVDAIQFGYVSNTGVETIDGLLSRGGIESVMYIVSLIICAVSFGGIIKAVDIINTLANRISKYINSVGSLITATVLTSIGINIITGDQALAIILPANIYEKFYKEKRLKPKNLSRTLEDAGTLTSVLVPWNCCGIFVASTLGVPTLAYLPFCFVNLINPIVAIVFGYLNITIEKYPEDEKIAITE